MFAARTYICDDGMTIMAGHKVLYGTGSSIFQLITTDEVICQIMLCCVGDGTVCDRNRAVGMRLDAVAIDCRHCDRITARDGRAERILSPVL